jgi:hypothetical protein
MPMVDQEAAASWPHTSTVVSGPGRTCPAPDQDNACGAAGRAGILLLRMLPMGSINIALTKRARHINMPGLRHSVVHATIRETWCRAPSYKPQASSSKLQATSCGNLSSMHQKWV